MLFKKGYLSRPKKHSTPNTDSTNTSTPSGAMSIVSTEETMSSSAQSIENSTPSISDVFDPFLYSGFYDQNGVFFVNRKQKWDFLFYFID